MKKSASWTDRAVRGSALLCFLVVSLWSGLSRGQQDFDHHYARAYRSYEAGRFTESIEAFEAAYALNPLPRLLINLGNAHRKLGQNQDALTCYQRYLQLEPRAPPALRAKVEGAIVQVRAQLSAEVRAQPSPPAPAPPAALRPPPPSSSAAPAPPGPRRARRWPYLVLGAVAAAVTAGVVTGVVVGSQHPPPGLAVGDQTYPGMQ